MSKQVKVEFRIAGEEEYGEEVSRAFDTLAHADLRLDFILGAIELRRSLYKRWGVQDSEPPPSAELAIKELLSGRPVKRKEKPNGR